MSGLLRLGLTGGIGSGKSTVAGLLAGHGAAIIDADAISRQTTAPAGTAVAAIRQTFGPEFITADGALDRVRMRQLVFSEPSARQQLEQIIHPLVGAETQRQTQAATQAGVRCIVYDIPLLVESGRWRAQLDQILVIDCEPGAQITRVMQRSGLARSEVERILAQQADRQDRLQAADHVICNDSLSLVDLASQVSQLALRFGL